MVLITARARDFPGAEVYAWMEARVSADSLRSGVSARYPRAERRGRGGTDMQQDVCIQFLGTRIASSQPFVRRALQNQGREASAYGCAFGFRPPHAAPPMHASRNARVVLLALGLSVHFEFTSAAGGRVAVTRTSSFGQRGQVMA